MTTFHKLGVLLSGIGLSWLGTSLPAAAQCHGGGHSHGYHGSSSGKSVLRTEDTNRWGLRFGALLALDGQKTLFGGAGLDSTYFVGKHWQVGGRLAFTNAAATPTNFGYDATGPTLSLANVGVELRYMLRNTHRWRLDALGGPGLNSYNLADHDRQVTTRCGCTSDAPVAYNNRPLVNAGLGLTYKLWPELWLTSEVRYVHLLESAPFGAADLQSQWQLSVAVTMPSGFVRREGKN